MYTQTHTQYDYCNAHVSMHIICGEFVLYMYMVHAWKYIPVLLIVYTWNTPIRHTDYACTMHGIRLYLYIAPNLVKAKCWSSSL